MNGVSAEIGTISRRAVAWGLTFFIASAVFWAGWMTTTLIDIRVSLAAIQERVGGIQREIDNSRLMNKLP